VFSIEDMLGHHTMVGAGGQYSGAMAVTSPDAMAGQVATPADTATPTASTAAGPATVAGVRENPTTWLIVTLGLGLALFWYGTGNLKVSL
jgi:hypothetical protein